MGKPKEQGCPSEIRGQTNSLEKAGSYPNFEERSFIYFQVCGSCL
jgi:hypothetical protein